MATVKRDSSAKSSGRSIAPHPEETAIDIVFPPRIKCFQREGRIQSAERAVPTLPPVKIANLLSCLILCGLQATHGRSFVCRKKNCRAAPAWSNIRSRPKNFSKKAKHLPRKHCSDSGTIFDRKNFHRKNFRRAASAWRTRN